MMGRPKGSRNKSVNEVVETLESSAVENQKKEVVTHEEERQETPQAVLTADQKRIADSRKALKHPLDPGQKFFEAPDGTIMVGEANKNHMWWRAGNGGHGMHINPRR
jgi:hypothetical protein